ncbi:MAG: GWxTD domain-containing protein [Thermaurantimonas sp.]
MIFNLLTLFTTAGNLDLRFAFYHFFDPEIRIYTETHFNVYGKSVKTVRNENGLYTGSVIITMTFYKDGSIIQGDKIRISLPEVQNPEFYNRGFTAKSQFRLPSGQVTLQLDISDENNSSETYHFEIEIDVPNPDHFKASDLMLIAGMTEPAGGELSKREFIPYITESSYLYDKDIDELYFYMEFYDLEDLDYRELPFFVNYYLESSHGGYPMEKFSGRIKIRNKNLHPVFGKLNIKELPSGTYNLVVESINRKNELYAQRKVRIERISDFQPEGMIAELIENFNLENSIVPIDILRDSIRDFLLYLMPIATYSEQKIIDRLLAESNKDMMMKYFNSFWLNKQTNGLTWPIYYERIQIANKQFGNRLLKGFRTDRGRVFCLYGPPTIIEGRKHEPNTYPYEIWQYDRLIAMNGTNVQSDRIFIFADREINTGTYRLIHSTASGETFNERWQYLLMERDMWTPNVDDVDLPAQAGDWGTRFNNSIIINSSKFGRYNRW